MWHTAAVQFHRKGTNKQTEIITIQVFQQDYLHFWRTPRGLVHVPTVTDELDHLLVGQSLIRLSCQCGHLPHHDAIGPESQKCHTSHSCTPGLVLLRLSRSIHVGGKTDRTLVQVCAGSPSSSNSWFMGSFKSTALYKYTKQQKGQVATHLTEESVWRWWCSITQFVSAHISVLWQYSTIDTISDQDAKQQNFSTSWIWSAAKASCLRMPNAGEQAWSKWFCSSNTKLVNEKKKSGYTHNHTFELSFMS